jgi:NADH:ubiquinone oxidoreductase subunit 4 (subunit M)
VNLSEPTNLLWGLVLLPAIASALTLVAAPWPRWRQGLGWLFALGQVGLSLAVLSAFDTPPSTGVSAGPLPIAQMAVSVDWLSTLESPARLGVDGLNLYALLLLAVVTLLALLVDPLDGLARAALRQAGVFAVCAAAVIFLTSRDLLLAAACHATAALALAGVMHLGAQSRPRRPAAQAFLTPALLASGLLWCAGIWAKAASDGLSASIDALVVSATPTGVALALTLFLVLHLPLVPLHRWQTHGCGEGAALSGIVLAGGLWMMLGVSGWLRLGLPLSSQALDDVGMVLMWWGAISAALGVGIASTRERIGDRLAWGCLASGGLVAMGLGALNLSATSGALLLCAALGLPRAASLVLVRWLPVETGGRRIGLWWSAMAVSLGAVAGTGAFAGLLPLLAGGSAWPVVVCVVVSTMLTGVLLAPVARVSARVDAPPMAWSLRLGLVLSLCVVIVSGWQPAWLAAWVTPDVERVLATAPMPQWSAGVDAGMESISAGSQPENGAPPTAPSSDRSPGDLTP